MVVTFSHVCIFTPRLVESYSLFDTGTHDPRNRPFRLPTLLKLHLLNKTIQRTSRSIARPLHTIFPRPNCAVRKHLLSHSRHRRLPSTILLHRDCIGPAMVTSEAARSPQAIQGMAISGLVAHSSVHCSDHCAVHWPWLGLEAAFGAS